MDAITISSAIPGAPMEEAAMPNGLFPRTVSGPAGACELAKTLYKTPLLFRHGVRCGKATCRCRRGELHGPYAFLYWRDERGRQRRRYVQRADVRAVEHIVTQRRAADREARRHATEAVAELTALRRWLRDLERSEVG